MFTGAVVIELKRTIAMDAEQRGKKGRGGEQRNTVPMKDYTFHDSSVRVEIGKAGGTITHDYQKREGGKESDRCPSVKPINLRSSHKIASLGLHRCIGGKGGR